MSTAVGEGGGLTVAHRIQGAKMSVLNEKCDFLHTKDFKIRNRIKGNTIIAFFSSLSSGRSF